jgi:hypothetical protein
MKCARKSRNEWRTTPIERTAIWKPPEVIDGEAVMVSMQCGDVLVFTLPTPHRPYVTLGMNGTRFRVDHRAAL